MTDEPRRTKVCAYCGAQYVDTTKRLVGRTCSKACACALGVATRMKNDSYERTPEQNRKLSASMKLKYADGWQPASSEWKQRRSEDMKRRWASGLMASQTKAAALKKYGVEHWTKSDEGRAAISKLHSGRRYSKDVRRKMSLSARRRLRTKRETLYTSARGGCRADLGGMYFRSNWEANFARIMNYRGVVWEYEPTTFELDETTSYTPDFLVEGTYYELKGRMSTLCEEKLTLFRKKYDDVVLEVIGPSEYSELGKTYKHLIPTWEGK